MTSLARSAITTLCVLVAALVFIAGNAPGPKPEGQIAGFALIIGLGFFAGRITAK